MAMKPQIAPYTVSGLQEKAGHRVAETLQDRLHELNDLQLTLKHAHWNVVGRDFIGVHEMLDPMIDAVRIMVDDVAERMATLGVSPVGTPGALVADRSWDDYPIGRASTMEHLAALDVVYARVTAAHRRAIEEFDDLDLVSQDMLIGQSAELEKFHWFVRAHLEDDSGQLKSAGATGEKAAAKKVAALGRRSSSRSGGRTAARSGSRKKS